MAKGDRRNSNKMKQRRARAQKKDRIKRAKVAVKAARVATKPAGKAKRES